MPDPGKRHGRLELAKRPRGVALGGAAVGGDHRVRRGFANGKIIRRRGVERLPRLCVRALRQVHARESHVSLAVRVVQAQKRVRGPRGGVQEARREARAHQVLLRAAHAGRAAAQRLEDP